MATAAAISRIGFGGAPIGGLYDAVTPEDAFAALDEAWNAGIRYFDTAPLYGYGQSEQRIGDFLRTKPRATFTVSTKVGRVLVPGRAASTARGRASFSAGSAYDVVFDFSAAGIRRSLEASLERLHLNYVDVAFIHDPDDALDVALNESVDALCRLRDEGMVRSVGAGMNVTAPLARFVRERRVDTVMIAGRYTLLDMSAGHALFPLCIAQNVRVVAAGVFNSGILAGVPDAESHYDYHAADPLTLARAQRIAAVCSRYGVPLRAAAIAFTLAHPAVSRVVLGMRSAAEVREDVAALAAMLPESLWHELSLLEDVWP